MRFDNKYMKISLYALFVVVAAIIVEKIISNLTGLQTTISSFIDFISKILSPFIFGLFVAYLLNPFTRWLETKLFSGDKPGKRIKRIVCATVALIMFTGVLIVIIAFILPELISSVQSLVLSLPDTLTDVQRSTEAFFKDSIEKYPYFTQKQIEDAFQPFMESFGTISEITTKVFDSTVKFGKGIFNFIIGIIIAFYMLIYKDGFKAYCTKVVFVLFEPEAAVKIIDNARRTNKIFEGFFVGKTIDSAIIGTIFFVGATFFIRPRYILLSSVIVGVTNMIPFFGPFIGGIPVVIINLFYDIKAGVFVGIFVLLLQLFDGYILGPKILGDSTGLSPFWVIASILVGSALFGIPGMLLGVPVFAVMKMFIDEDVDKKFHQKYGKRFDLQKENENENDENESRA